MTAEVPAGICAAKTALRRLLRARRRAIPHTVRNAAAQQISMFADHIKTRAGGRIVSGFVALGSEIDPAALMARLAAEGVPLALPRVEGDRLVFHAHTVGEALVAGPIGLLEPPADAAIVSPGLLLVPLLGFDRRGNRLGYGKGYYDRALAGLPQAVTIGLAFATQEEPALPVEPTDQPLDYVLTEAGLIDCRAQRGQ